MNASQRFNESVRADLHDGVATLWFSTPSRSVNVLDASTLSGLALALNWLEQVLESVECLVLRSEKDNCFFVGADVQAIASLQSAAEAEHVIQLGQDLFQRLEDLPCSTVAAINGSCFGGGLELALACDYRVALQSSKTRFALPEIKLGLIPGWGGTQRLPQVVGLQQALKMILTGRGLQVDEALDCFLIDKSLPLEYWDVFFSSERLQRFCRDQKAELKNLRANQGLKTKVIRWALDDTFIGKQWLLRLATRKSASKAKAYPALQEAIDAIRAGVLSGRSSHNGYAIEREGFGRLLQSRTAQNLIGIFLNRDKAKKPATWLPEAIKPSAEDQALPKVVVVGAGAMGAGIGTLIASRGCSVVFKELNEDAIEAGKRRVIELLDGQVARGSVSPLEMRATLGRMLFTTRWRDIEDCDLAIEAVVEVEAVKREVFEMLHQHLPANAILCSNTSSLSVTQMATKIPRNANVAGLHFFNPVQRMELVEVVRTESTSEQTLARLLAFVKVLGKTPVVVTDKPGFLVNRVLFPYLGEAIRMVSEGVEVEEIDRQMRRFGMPMGPLELLDQVGLDVAHHVAKSLCSILPEAREPAEYLGQMVAKGWLGRKSSVGFYLYDHSQNTAVNIALRQEACLPLEQLETKSDGLNSIQRRLVYPILNESVHCLDEYVVAEPWMVDLGMVLGTGFAPHLGGPIQLLDSIGCDVMLQNLRLMAHAYGARFEAADGFLRVQQQAEPFFAKDRRPLTWESEHEPRYTTQS